MLIDRTTFFVKEHVGMLKLTDTYDILDPENGQRIAIAQEKPGTFFKFLRLLVNKQMLPTKVVVSEQEDGEAILTIRRGFTFIRATVEVVGADGETVGFLRSKLFSLGGGFHVLDRERTKVAEVKGDWKGWNFKLLDAAGRELGTVTKKWAGLGKELFTSADNYVISLADGTKPNPTVTTLLLAAGLAIDTVFKEKN